MPTFEIKYKTPQAREVLPAKVVADHYVQHGRFFEFWSSTLAFDRELLVSIAAESVLQITLSKDPS